MTRIIFLMISVLLANTQSYAAKKMHKKWVPPLTVKNPHNLNPVFSPRLEVTKVVFDDSCTTVEAEAQFRPEYVYGLGPDVHLVADGKIYELLNSEGLELSDTLRMPDRSAHRFAMRFEPLPKDVQSFDLVQKRYTLNGISDPDYVRRRIIGSDWRDDHSGDWVIGVYPEGVIYDGRFWQYAGNRPDDSSAEFDMTDGEKQLTVKVGKRKKGRRMFVIDGKKYACSQLEGKYLQPYPMRDSSGKLRDNGYTKGDSTTVRGWLRNMPAGLREKNSPYTIACEGTFGSMKGSGTIDSLGLFSITMPLANTSFATMDWVHTFIRTVLEPGEEYFLLYDYDTGKILWMGRDARLQNELSIYQPTWASFDKYNHPEMSNEQYFTTFIERWDGAHAELDSICRATPTLSDRFRTVSSSVIDNNFAYSLGQSRFELSPRGLTEEMAAFAYEHFFANPPQPLTLGGFYYTVFIHDFTQDRIKHTSPIAREEVNDEVLKSDIDEESKRQWSRLDSLRNHWEPIILAQTDTARMMALADSVDKINAHILEPLKGNRKLQNLLTNIEQSLDLRYRLEKLDSLVPRADLRDLWLEQELTSYLNNINQPLPAPMLEIARKEIKIPMALDAVESLNNEYIVLVQARAKRKAINDTITLKPVDLTGLTDGKEIIEKILEPLRDRVVLIDIWGTWCSPCREALSHSAELYETLQEYDMAYVYLANNSPEEAWLNVIDKFNVKGKNVIHYNLPPNQQEAVERYFGVSSWPSYRIAGKDGKTPNITVNARNLNALKNVVKMLSTMEVGR